MSATRSPELILIDEPELNLHPALQLDFLSTVGSFARTGVLFATHSMGLARAGSETIYSVLRLDQGRSEVRLLEDTPDMAEFLGELSLSGYQELGFETVLLVEGPTELRTVQRFLRLYGLEHKVVLLPLGGGSLIRPGVEDLLREILRLTDSVVALIDSEKPSADAPLPEDRAAFLAACETVGVECHVLERRALENYFSPTAVAAALGERFTSLTEYQLLKDAPQPWSKRKDNARIAHQMTLTDLQGTDLDAFFRRIPTGSA